MWSYTMTTSFDERASALRRAFDDAFALPAAERPPTDDFIAIGIGSAAFALRLRDVARLSPMPRVASVPTTRPHVIGIASVRGRLVAVHSIAMVLGYPSTSCRWLAQCAEAVSIGLAIERFDGFLRASASDVHDDVVRVGDIPRRIIDVKALTKIIDPTAGDAGTTRSDT
jgi:chemotaxis signal transduction protein